MSIRINATVNEARAAAGHKREQWNRFYHLTKDETRQLADTHPDWTRWILIPSDEKERLLERVNGLLQAEGIPPVEMIILKWRVSQLLRDIQRKYSTTFANDWCLAEGSMTKGMQGSLSGSPVKHRIEVEPRSSGSSVQQSSSPQRWEYSPSETRPYDPIRDV
ncbi:uncharacterized protein M421DRAFT_61389 [Didymella exigua CBS 183.55]|uniref:Uncharacterized protein n=1 Tax=Didymella exigua CBS 183.55 TaxID=1150837 RepID=A0A6A5RQB6_9PLEO|nr:uncharacterized protein M421DRAFT_61389 [Didymella exigua CBS 183.55]KAF1929358.1 hypothetical protein M421DRAFT_61389 [Didymella exigua CBS 183.55]